MDSSLAEVRLRSWKSRNEHLYFLPGTSSGNCLRHVLEIIRDFTSRRITFDSDTLKACSAILSRHDEGPEDGPSGFLFGLPTIMFAEALCWYPINGHSPLRRRTQLPSWSWAGWRDTMSWGDKHRRVDRWEMSGIISPTALDKELWDKYGRIVTPVRQHFSNAPGPTVPMAPESPILQFWTSSVLVAVSKTQTIGRRGMLLGAKGVPDSPIDHPHLRSYGLQCDPAWRAQAPEKLEFIAIAAAHIEPERRICNYFGSVDPRTRLAPGFDDAADADDYQFDRDRVVVDVMCIEWRDDIAYRSSVLRMAIGEVDGPRPGGKTGSFGVVRQD